MVNQIKFSHQYIKMFALEPEAVLISVTRIKDFKAFAQEHSMFIRYDTAFYGRKAVVGEPKTYSYYDLGDIDDAIILVFYMGMEALAEHGRVFTTIRKWTYEKEMYYTDKIGEQFELVFVKEGN